MRLNPIILIDWIAIASIFLGWILIILWSYNKTIDVGLAFLDLLDDIRRKRAGF